MPWVDATGRRVELIILDRCDGRGAQQWIRVSWHGVLYGDGTPGGPGQGYFRAVGEALRHLNGNSAPSPR